MGQKVVKSISSIPKVSGWQPPIMFDLSNQADTSKLQKLIEQNEVNFVSDEISEAIEELYHMYNPTEIDKVDQVNYSEFIKKFTSEGGTYDAYGTWVYYPWSQNLVHFPQKDDFRKLRGLRNRNLITEDERQKLISNKTILILGLSVGSNVADLLLLQGIGSRYILVDMDSLSPTNLNRIRVGYEQVGIHKVDVVAKKLSGLDPFLEQVHYKSGINEINLEEILTKYKPDIIVDEMDSLRMKMVIRTRAKEMGIPVVMATDNGDNILLDIERFDEQEDLPILHGILPDNILNDILNNKEMSRREAGAIIGRYFVDLKNVPLRMIESLLEVGRTIPSWPQLGGAAVLSGLYVAYAVKKIILNQPLSTGRFLMGPDYQLDPSIATAKYNAQKDKLIEIMTK